MGLVFSVDLVAETDGPGLRTVFYLKGCRLRCWWCHSPEGQKKQTQVLFHPELCDGCGRCLPACSAGAISFESGVPTLDRTKCHACGLCIEFCEPGAIEISGWWLKLPDAVARIERDRAQVGPKYGGVTVSGGDLTLQPEFTKEILAACRERGIHTAIETNAAGPWESLRPIAALADLIYVDLKHMDPAEHEKLTGIPNDLILANLKSLVESGANVEVWMPLVPGRNDTDENLRATVAFVASLGLRRIGFHPFEVFGREKYDALGRTYWLGHLRPQTSARLEEILAIAAAAGLEGWIVPTLSQQEASAQPAS